MTAREAHKAQWQALKDKPLSDKLKYIFTYYWPAILGCVCVLIFLSSWLGNVLTQKDAALSGYLINGFTKDSYAGDFNQEVMDHLQIDSNEYRFKLTADVAYSSTEVSDTSIAVLESIVVQAFAQELDFIVADLENYPVLSAYYADLRSVMSEEQLQQWEDYLIYVEKAELEKLTSGSLEQVTFPEYHLSAEGLTEPIPLGIQIPQTSRLFDAYQYGSKTVVFGITSSILNVENTLAFLQYIMN